MSQQYFSELLFDPHAGSLDFEQQEMSRQTFIDFIKEEFNYYISPAAIRYLFLQLESEKRLLDPYLSYYAEEYFINELLYELRFAQNDHDADFERHALANWIRRISKLMGVQAGELFRELIFVNRVLRRR